MLSVLIRRGTITLLAGVWGFAVIGGFILLNRYKSTAGAAAAPPERWPVSARVERASGATLLMFAHPMCPCTRASLTELGHLMERLHGQVTARILFATPQDREHDWSGSALWAQARAIPDSTVLTDPDGREAEAFGVKTSGQVVYYDAAGVLRFRGGITIARGHEGESPGADRIAALARGEAPDHDSAPVFGCSLVAP